MSGMAFGGMVILDRSFRAYRADGCMEIGQETTPAGGARNVAGWNLLGTYDAHAVSTRLTSD
jgi:hypothetical protein